MQCTKRFLFLQSVLRKHAVEGAQLSKRNALIDDTNAFSASWQRDGGGNGNAPWPGEREAHAGERRSRDWVITLITLITLNRRAHNYGVSPAMWTASPIAHRLSAQEARTRWHPQSRPTQGQSEPNRGNDAVRPETRNENPTTIGIPHKIEKRAHSNPDLRESCKTRFISPARPVLALQCVQARQTRARDVEQGRVIARTMQASAHGQSRHCGIAARHIAERKARMLMDW